MLMLLVGLGVPSGILIITFHWNGSNPLFLVINIAVELIAFCISILLARRFLDHRSFVSLGFKLDRRVIPDLLAGFLITMVIMCTIYLVLEWFGWSHFDGFAWRFDPLTVVLGQLAFYLLIYMIVGFQEELLSRGYHLQTLASGINSFWGVMISSAVFGILHLSNPNATWVSAAGIFFAGLFLALAYLRTGQLWLSIGLHFGWNFFEGVVFGFPVSGLYSYHLLRISVSGPVIWTGGDFGPEAGLVVLPAIALGTVLILWYTKSSKPKIKKQ